MLRGGERMRKFILVGTLSTLLAFSYGCATKEYVKQQVEEALKASNERCMKAEAAAERAEAAAKQAQSSAEKTKKAFELQQKK
jgi:hypothetical protein